MEYVVFRLDEFSECILKPQRTEVVYLARGIQAIKAQPITQRHECIEPTFSRNLMATPGPFYASPCHQIELG